MHTSSIAHKHQSAAIGCLSGRTSIWRHLCQHGWTIVQREHIRRYLTFPAYAGLSRLLDGTTNGTSIPVSNMIGTVAYTAPEIFRDSFVTKPSDVYAFGILSKGPSRPPLLHWTAFF